MPDAEATGPDAPQGDQRNVRHEPAVERKAPSGRLDAFRSLARELTPEDLQSPGVAKLIVNQLDQLGSEREELLGYVERFHEADKLAAVLQEQLKTNRTVEVLVAAALSVGGAVLGFVPYLWDHGQTSTIGNVAGGIGLAIILLAVLGRLGKL